MYNRELTHFGIKGMKWGKRKTRLQKAKLTTNTGNTKEDEKSADAKAKQKARIKRAVQIGATVAGTALATYGAYKLHEYVRKENHNIRMEQARQFLSNTMPNQAYRLYDPRSDRPTLKSLSGKTKTDFLRDVYKTYTEQAANDSFGKAAVNVLLNKMGKEVL